MNCEHSTPHLRFRLKRGREKTVLLKKIAYEYGVRFQVHFCIINAYTSLWVNLCFINGVQVLCEKEIT